MAITKRQALLRTAIVVIIVSLVGTVAFLGANAKMTADIADAHAELNRLKDETTTAETSVRSESQKNAAEALGISTAKKAADDKLAASFFTDVFTWDSYESYNQMRTCLTDEWGLDASGAFMSKVAPEVTEVVGYQPKSDAVGKYDVEETRVNEIDANHLNMSYVSMESYLMDIDADGGYGYIAEVIVESVSTSGGTARRTYTVAYTVSSDSKTVLNPVAYGSEYYYEGDD